MLIRVCHMLGITSILSSQSCWKHTMYPLGHLWYECSAVHCIILICPATIQSFRGLLQVDLNGDKAKEVIVATHDAHLQVRTHINGPTAVMRFHAHPPHSAGAETPACWTSWRRICSSSCDS